MPDAGRASADTATTRREPLTAVAKGLFYLGIGFEPLMTLRGPAGVLASDVLLMVSAALLALPLGDALPRRVSVARCVAGAAVILGGMLAAYRADAVGDSLFATMKTVFVVSVLPWQARKAIQSDRDLESAALWWMAGVLLCTIGAVAQLVISPTIIPGTEAVWGRYPGFTQHVSDFGGLLASVVPLCGVMLFRSGSRRRRWLALAMLVLFVWGLILDGSISAILSILVAAGYSVLRGGLPLRPTLLLVAAVVSVFSILLMSNGTFATTPLQRFLTTSGLMVSSVPDSSTLGSRLTTDRLAITALAEEPLIGRGMDPGSGVIFNGLGVHNLILAAGYQGGVLVLFGIVVSVGTVVRAASSRWSGVWLGDAWVAAFVGSLAFAMTAPSLYNRFFWVPAAMVLAARDIRTRGVAGEQAAGRAVRPKTPIAWSDIVARERGSRIDGH